MIGALRSRLLTGGFERINHSLQRRGYAIVDGRSVSREASEAFAVLLGLSQHRRLDLVVVGAGSDDGELSDPGIDFAVRHPERVRTAVLIEPIPERAQRSRNRLGDGVDVRVVQCAVGSDSAQSLLLWETDDWAVERLDARARRQSGPSGGRGWTSASREHVARHLRSTLRIPLDEALAHVVSREAEVRPLQRILDDEGLEGIDYLQTDTEGFDDEVLYSADLRRARPQVIRFERIHLDAARLMALDGYLRQGGYAHSHDGGFDRVYVQIPRLTA